VIAFFWAAFLQATEEAQNIWYLVCLFPLKKFCIKFDEKWVVPLFEQNFHKIIRSPCRTLLSFLSTSLCRFFGHLSI
jgi:hypothetical protein